MKYQFVPLFAPELYNGIGGELSVEDILKQLGQIIKKARQAIELTQDELIRMIPLCNERDQKIIMSTLKTMLDTI